jgi:hypothetical protein
MTRLRETMPTSKFKRYAAQCIELGAEQLDLYGYGEALLDPDFTSKLAFCKECGVGASLTTNGSMLTERLAAELIENGLTHIRFSLHGVDAEQYEKVHRGLKWNNVVSNFVGFCDLNHQAGHPVKVHIVSLSFNGEPTSLIRNRWENMCDELEIWKPHNWAGGRAYREVKFTKRTCGRPFNGPVQVNVDGSLMVCCFDYDAQMVIGDANAEPIKDILERSVTLTQIMKAHTEGLYEGLPCEHCDQLKVYDESPLLYSTTDPDRQIGKIAITKQTVEV